MTPHSAPSQVSTVVLDAPIPSPPLSLPLTITSHILGLYDDFEYMVQLDIESFVEEFAEKNPTLDDYNSEMQRLYDDIEKIKTRSLNEVAFELLKVPACTAACI